MAFFQEIAPTDSTGPCIAHRALTSQKTDPPDISLIPAPDTDTLTLITPSTSLTQTQSSRPWPTISEGSHSSSTGHGVPGSRTSSTHQPGSGTEAPTSISSDTAIATTTKSSALETSSTRSSSVSYTTVAKGTETSSTESGHGTPLSRGSTAGITAGAIIGTLIAVAAMYWLWRRYKKHRASKRGALRPQEPSVSASQPAPQPNLWAERPRYLNANYEPVSSMHPDGYELRPLSNQGTR